MQQRGRNPQLVGRLRLHADVLTRPCSIFVPRRSPLLQRWPRQSRHDSPRLRIHARVYGFDALSAIASSLSMTPSNTLIGWAPVTGTPLMKNEGVELSPNCRAWSA